MSEQFLINQLDEAIDAIIARRDLTPLATEASVVSDLAALSALGLELSQLPRESFKSNLKETLRRSAIMTTAGTSAGIQTPQPEPVRAGYQTITPYLTVQRAEQLVDFVKTAFDGVEVFRTTGSAGNQPPRSHSSRKYGLLLLMISSFLS